MFTTVRLREGYDLGEVDDFLGRVERTLNAVLQENATLRGRRDAPGAGPRQGGEPRSARAERIIALAQTVADQAVMDAYAQAAQIVADAESRAAEIERRAADEAAGIRLHADGLHVHAQEYRNQLRSGLEMQIRSAEEQLRLLEGEPGGGAYPAMAGASSVPSLSPSPSPCPSGAVTRLRQGPVDWGVRPRREDSGIGPRRDGISVGARLDEYGAAENTA
ncbi:hypothetical protein SZN_11328 [Streptomyces zinciresistens K42]|uniref:Cell wall synthesis protein Wag31 n=1 Tax=Streptomyces zinciresistens K42 TaxID=700597 RepID=G2G9U5_9ACTN|nr:hypothetical protein SZN_11328 [Streptomyces zinciresistens K42]